MTVQDWLGLGSDPEEQDRELDGAKDRAQARLDILNLFKRKQIGDKDKPTILWLLTREKGEQFRHVITLPSGKLSIRNCAATKDQQENAIQICPYCAFVAAGGGKNEKGDTPRMNHEYYWIGIVGQVEKMMVVDSATGEAKGQKNIIRWMHQPQCVAATAPITRGLLKYHRNREFPPGANGDISKFPHKLWAVPGKTDKDVRYWADFYDGQDAGKEPPRKAYNENNELVDIDYSIGRKIYEQVVAHCAPSKPETLRSILEGSGGDDESPRQPAGSTPTAVGKAHEFEDDGDSPDGGSVPDDENF